jgi:3-hydroxyacyl-CoA dehydrogenase
MHYGDLYLGKTTVLCKDTPAFIANRIGVYGIMSLFKLVDKLNLTIDEVDALTGPIIGRPKSATFRTADVVGIDTLVKVAKGVYENCPNDEARETFLIPDWLDKMVMNSWLGEKSGQGFFKKMPPSAVRTGTGGPKVEKEIYTIDLKTLEYKPRAKSKFASVDGAKLSMTWKQRLKMLVAAQDKAGEFYRHFHYGLFSYVSHRIPEISDEIYRIDDAMMAGFGWEIGAFESWDVLGVDRTVQAMKEAGYRTAQWVDQMIAAGNKSFYKIEKGRKLFYDPSSKTYKPIPGSDSFIIMSNYQDKLVWKNSSCDLFDLGDDVLRSAMVNQNEQYRW